MQVRTPVPVNITQYIYIEYEEIINMEKHMRLLYANKNIEIPIVDSKPKTVNMYELSKEETRLMEWRGACLEKFLNEIFKN